MQAPLKPNGILLQNQACETKSTNKFSGVVLAAGEKGKMIFFNWAKYSRCPQHS